MVSLEQKIKEYVSSVEIPDRVKPEEIGDCSRITEI